MKAMNAQKHQKMNVTPPIVSQSNNTLSTVNAGNYKFIAPSPHVSDVNKQGVYVVAPAVLAVTNNS